MSRSPILLAPVYKPLRSLGLESRATIVARFSKPSERSELLTVADWLANDASGLLRFLFSLGLADREKFDPTQEIGETRESGSVFHTEPGEMSNVPDWLANVSFADSVDACLQTTSLPRLGKASDYEEANC